MLNTLHRFAAAAAAPILLNLSMMAALALAAFFPTAGHAAAWGVLIAGVLEVLLLLADAGRAGVHCAFPLAADRRGRAQILPCARSRDNRLRRRAACALCRHGDRELSRHRRAVGALLCGPSQSIADRRDRHRDRHRAAAGHGAQDRRRRRGRREPCAEPRLRADIAPVHSLRCRLPDRARSDHARAVPARRLHRERCAGRRRDIVGLCDRAYSRSS